MIPARSAKESVSRDGDSNTTSVPGVTAVYTGADVPGELKTGLIHQDWPCFIPVGGTTSHRGDVLAMIHREGEVLSENCGSGRMIASWVEPLAGFSNAIGQK